METLQTVLTLETIHTVELDFYLGGNLSKSRFSTILFVSIELFLVLFFLVTGKQSPVKVKKRKERE